MNPMALAALGSILRWLLAIAAGYLVRLGIWDAAEAATYVTALSAAGALAIASLALSLWQKYQERRKLVTALAAKAPMSENDVADIVKDMRTPSVTTPPDRVPKVT